MAIFPSTSISLGLPSLTGNSISVVPVVQQTNQLTSIEPITPFPVTNDEITNLKPLTLKNDTSDVGINFPGIVFTESQDKALIAHRYPHVDGARVENMGANEQVYQIKAMLTNNIFPGQGETWQYGNLFPNVFNQLIAMMSDNNPKVLVHPIKGNVNVQIKSWNWSAVGKGPRDGVVLDFVCWETIIDDLATISSQPTAGSASTNAAANIDQQWQAMPPGINPPSLSMSQFFGQLNSIIRGAISLPSNAISSLNTQLLGITSSITGIASAILTAPAFTVNSILQTIIQDSNIVLGSPLGSGTYSVSGIPVVSQIYHYDLSTVQAIQSLVNLNYSNSSSASQLLSKTNTSLFYLIQHYINQNNSVAAPMIEALKQYQYQVQQMQIQLPQSGQGQQYNNIKTYVTKTQIGWIELSKILNNNIDSLLSLNPSLIKSTSISANSQINYLQA